MPPKPVPDDREMMSVLQKLKAYTSYKGRQSQTPPSENHGAVDDDLQTVENWAKDTNDDGAAWGQRNEHEASQKQKEAARWQEQIKQDDVQAAKDEKFQASLDRTAVKDQLKKKLEDYASSMQGLADAGEPGFKGKAALVKRQTTDAKKFVDENFDKSFDSAAKIGAQQRAQNKAVAQIMEKRGEDGQKWKSEFGGQPGKFPAGQCADVEAALDRIAVAAGQMGGELQAFGARAAPHVEKLANVQAWTAKLKPQVGSQGPALKSAKALGASGAAEAHTAFDGAESFQSSLETESNENLDLYRRWTERNNQLAKAMIQSDDPKYRQWAEAWMNISKAK